MTTVFSNNDDMIDVRDIIARVEALEDIAETPDWSIEDNDELSMLQNLLSELCDAGGDEKWRGDWYPSHLIRDSYFKDYAQQLAEDIGAIDADATWPNTCIDWYQASRELRTDYTSVEVYGTIYWTR
jgi:hypothetical protein